MSSFIHILLFDLHRSSFCVSFAIYSALNTRQNSNWECSNLILCPVCHATSPRLDNVVLQKTTARKHIPWERSVIWMQIWDRRMSGNPENMLLECIATSAPACTLPAHLSTWFSMLPALYIKGCLSQHGTKTDTVYI